MGTNKSMKETKELKKLLLKNGFEEVRTSGGHTIYKRGDSTVAVNVRLNRMVCQRIIKENNLK